MPYIKEERFLSILNESLGFYDHFLTCETVISTQGPASQGAGEHEIITRL